MPVCPISGANPPGSFLKEYANVYHNLAWQLKPLPNLS